MLFLNTFLEYYHRGPPQMIHMIQIFLFQIFYCFWSLLALFLSQGFWGRGCMEQFFWKYIFSFDELFDWEFFDWVKSMMNGFFVEKSQTQAVAWKTFSVQWSQTCSAATNSAERGFSASSQRLITKETLFCRWLSPWDQILDFWHLSKIKKFPWTNSNYSDSNRCWACSISAMVDPQS